MSSRARSRSRSRSRERRHKHDRRHRDDRDKERDSRDSRSERDRRDYKEKDRDSRDKRDSHRERDDKKEKYETNSSSGKLGQNDSNHAGDNIKNNAAPVSTSADKSAAPAPLLPSGLSITKNAAQLASILAKTKQQLEEQKKKLLEKVKETEQTSDAPKPVKKESKAAAPSLVTIEPAPVKEELDVFAIPVRVPTTLKANQRLQQAEEQRLEQKARTLDKMLKTTGKGAPVPEDRIEEQFFDPRLGKDPTRRKKRAFNFIEPGTYVDQANYERETKRQRVESGADESSAASVKKEEPVSAVSDTVTRDKKTADQIPDVEWWDLPFLEVTREDSEGRKVSLPPSYELHVLEDKINKLIEHPTVIAPPAEAPAPPPQKLKLTAAERKKMRRQERARARELEHEKYLLGLTEAPKPKVKISNMMRVYGSEAVQDPTQLEALVKKEMAERQERHEQRNEERKLTPEERREKKRSKMLEDTKLLSHVAVFKIPATALSDPKIRFKIDRNASQNYLSGTGVVTPSMAIVVIEGGPNAIKRYKKLMLRRIQWKAVAGDKTDEAEDDEEDDEEEQDRERANSRYCQMVWEGEVLKPTFRSFRVEQFADETAARKFLADNGVPHYFDACKRTLAAAGELVL